MKYRKKPVTIDAVQWEGTMESLKDITDLYAPTKPWEDCIRNVDSNSPIDFNEKTMSLYIHTTEGIMEAPKDWFIIKGVEGEFYPCKPSVFYKTYEPAKLVSIVVYDDDLRKYDRLPERVYVVPTDEGDLPTVQTANGEEIIREGDVLVYHPDGRIDKYKNEDVEFFFDRIIAGKEVYSYEPKT